MKHFILLFTAVCVGLPAFSGYAATSRCSKMNLTRCLDSACAINASINPAARCQYCGSSNSGEPPSTKNLTNVTAGQSTKYALSAKELAVAPSDPGQRYVWATTECIKKLPDCTPDDASAAYDKLIEQSCKNAGVTMQIAATMSSINKKPTKTKCNETFTICMDKKCGSGFDSCPTDADFDRSIAECGVDATGCEEYLAEFRKTYASSRDKVVKNRDNLVAAIAKDYQNKRNAMVNETLSACKNGSITKTCVDTVCNNNMRGKCKSADEKTMAQQLCKFYEIACTVLK